MLLYVIMTMMAILDHTVCERSIPRCFCPEIQRPQGSVSGAILFFYMSHLSNVISGHAMSRVSFADDLSVTSTGLLMHTQECIDDVKF